MGNIQYTCVVENVTEGTLCSQLSFFLDRLFCRLVFGFFAKGVFVCYVSEHPEIVRARGFLKLYVFKLHLKHFRTYSLIRVSAYGQFK